jgi:hypothetical protein
MNKGDPPCRFGIGRGWTAQRLDNRKLDVQCASSKPYRDLFIVKHFLELQPRDWRWIASWLVAGKARPKFGGGMARARPEDTFSTSHFAHVNPRGL